MTKDKMITPDRVDLEIMYCLFEKANNQFSSFSVAEIKSRMESSGSKKSICYSTYLNRLNKRLIPAGLVAEGIKDVNAKTFYLTPEGTRFIEEMVIPNIDLYEEVVTNE